LPELLRKLREKQVDRGLRPWREMAAIRLCRGRRGVRACTRSRRQLPCDCCASWAAFDGMIGMLPFAGGVDPRPVFSRAEVRQNFPFAVRFAPKAAVRKV